MSAQNTNITRLIAATGLLMLAAGSAYAYGNDTAAVCWSNGPRTECAAEPTYKAASDYGRTQCRFWSSGAQKVEIARSIRRSTTRRLSLNSVSVSSLK